MGLLNCNPIFNYYVSTKHHFRTVHYIHTFIQTEFISAAEAIFGKRILPAASVITTSTASSELSTNACPSE